LRGVVDADIQSANLDYLNGTVYAHNITIVNAKEEFVIDSISAVTSSSEKNTLYKWMLRLMENKLSKKATALSNSIATYYNSSVKF
jgi:hypothetical protein